MKPDKLPVRLAIVCAAVLSVAGCQTQRPGSATGSARQIFGTDIIGAQGKTASDQTAIDLTVAGPCEVGIYRAQECRQHREASAARRAELKQD